MKLTSAIEKLDLNKVKGFRKDFLTLMSNADKIRDYDTAVIWKRYVSKWRNDFEDYVGKYLVHKVKAMQYGEYANESDANYWDKRIREETWSFIVGFQVPLDMIDEYHSRDRVFGDLQRGMQSWKRRVMGDARKAWAVLEEFVEWYSNLSKSDGFDVEVPVEENMELAGFKISIKAAPDFDTAKPYVDGLEEGLKRYRAKASKVYPWLIHNQLPMIMDFGVGFDVGGEYKGNHIELNGYSCRDPNNIVHIMAHEMAHHRYRMMGGEQRNFWETMISGDLGELDLEEVVSRFGSDYRIFDNPDLQRKDPMLYYQLDGLRYGQNRDLRNFTRVGDLKKYMDDGGVRKVNVHYHPISSYANKNAEEAFCEALGMLVAYGPNTLPDVVIGWLRVVLPQVRVASAVRDLLVMAKELLSQDK